MIIDMHVHTRASGDSSATLDDYCRLIQQFRKYHPFHGLVLTEHCRYDRKTDFHKIGDRYEILILHGVEADTNLGHLLLYGITDRFLQKIDVSRKNLDSQKVIKTINDYGGIAIPAHPFRNSIFGRALNKNEIDLSEVRIIEELNGGNSGGQNKKASSLMDKNNLMGIGGSDAHYANRDWFLNCATEFHNPVYSIEDLVRELRQGRFRAVHLDGRTLERS